MPTCTAWLLKLLGEAGKLTKLDTCDFVQVSVQITPTQLRIEVAGRIILNGKLYHEIKQEDSIWLFEDCMLHLSMLKRNRRGNYANYCTNADTYWRSVVQNAPHQETLQLTWPPLRYYQLPEEESAEHAQLVAA